MIDHESAAPAHESDASAAKPPQQQHACYLATKQGSFDLAGELASLHFSERGEYTQRVASRLEGDELSRMASHALVLVQTRHILPFLLDKISAMVDHAAYRLLQIRNSDPKDPLQDESQLHLCITELELFLRQHSCARMSRLLDSFVEDSFEMEQELQHSWKEARENGTRVLECCGALHPRSAGAGPLHVRAPRSDDYLPHADRILQQLQDTLEQHKRLAIVGMYGLGQAVIASKLFESLKHRFTKAVYLVVAGEDPPGDDRRVLQLLYTAWRQCFGSHAVPTFVNPQTGCHMLAQRLRGERVLLVLEDVCSATQLLFLDFLHAVEPHSDSSRLVLTSSNHRIFTSNHPIFTDTCGGPHWAIATQAWQDAVVPPRSLEEQDAYKLLCWHAFGSQQPEHGLRQELLDAVVLECHGLPATLIAVGKHLRDQPAEAWQLVLQQLQSMALNATTALVEQVLAPAKRSFEGLKMLTKKFFKQCAVFPQWDAVPEHQLHSQWRTLAPLNAHSGVSNWVLAKARELESRCLITRAGLNEYGAVVYTMHPVVHAFAAVMARNDCGLHLPCYADQEAPETHPPHTWPQIHSAVNTPTVQTTAHTISLHSMSFINLRLEAKEAQSLVLDNNPLQILSGLSASTRLRYLSLARTNILKLPTEVSDLYLLESLNLTGCTCLTRLPESLTRLRLLRVLHLDGCTSMKRVSQAVGHLLNLRSLHLSHCSSLVAVPHSISHPKHLTHLTLSHCVTLTELCVNVADMPALKHLDLQHCSSLQALPQDFSRLTTLTNLDLTGCTSLVKFHAAVHTLWQLHHAPNCFRAPGPPPGSSEAATSLEYCRLDHTAQSGELQRSSADVQGHRSEGTCQVSQQAQEASLVRDVLEPLNRTALVKPGWRLGVEGARVLATPLMRLGDLTCLNLSDTELGPDGVAALGLGLRSLVHLLDLDLSGNEMRTEGARRLAGPMAAMPRLSRLDIASNAIGGAGIVALTGVLHGLKDLSELCVSNNKLRDAGVASLISHWPETSSLTRVALDKNQVNLQGKAAPRWMQGIIYWGEDRNFSSGGSSVVGGAAPCQLQNVSLVQDKYQELLESIKTFQKLLDEENPMVRFLGQMAEACHFVTLKGSVCEFVILCSLRNVFCWMRERLSCRADASVTGTAAQTASYIDAMLRHEARDLMIGFVQMLALCASPSAAGVVRERVRCVRVAQPSVVAQQVNNLLLVIDAFSDNNVSPYSFQLLINAFKGKTFQLQLESTQLWREWSDVSSQVVECVEPNEVKSALQRMILCHEAEEWPAQLTCDPVPRAGKMSTADVVAAFKAGVAVFLGMVPCPVSGCQLGLPWDSMPVRMRCCKRILSRSAAEASSRAQRCLYCENSLESMKRAPYKVERQLVRLMQAVNGVKVIDDHELLVQQRIGQGGQAQVHRGVWQGEAVAVKELSFSDGLRGGADSSVERLLHVGNLVGISHMAGESCCGINKLLAVAWKHSSALLVYEHCDQTLVEVVRQQASVRGLGPPTALPLHGNGPSTWPVCCGLRPTDVALLILELASACDAMHSHAKVVHCDITPENVLLLNKHVCLIDFGIAAQLSTTTATVHTAASAPPGKLHYASPEQATGTRPSPGMDVYSIGATAVFSATNAPPFQGSAVQVMHKLHIERQAMRVPDGLPKALRDLIMEMVRLDPKRRPDMDDVVRRSLQVYLQLSASDPPQVLAPTWW